MLDLAKLERLVRGRASVADIAREAGITAPTTPPNILLARCAIARWFDRGLYQKLLAKDLDNAPRWEEFKEDSNVTIVDAKRERYCLREPLREKSLSYWKQARPGLKAYCISLAEYFKNGDALDHFAALILANPTEGLIEFQRLYHAADADFNVTDCDALLRILRNRDDFLEQPLLDALNDREQYLRSRSMFADDYWRTVAFVERDGLAKHFDQWRIAPERWLLNLHGKGGLGKTMFLRWLIARRCVIERRGERVPVARLDFDLLDRPSLARWPWLALIPAMQQLNPQLPQSPFNDLLKSWEPFGAVLHKPGTSSRQLSRALLLGTLKASADSLGRDVPIRFNSALGSNAVVLVIDTIEDLMLHYRAGLSAMLELLVATQKECKNLHVILSGRYNLADPNRLPKFMEANCAPIDRVQINGFSKKESLRYLHELRGLQKGPRLGAIYKKTKGNPFALSLFADLCLEDPTLTAAKIAKYPKAEFAYLIERIIERIPPREHAVAWLLRYAAVPRQLTFDFVQHVLGKHLEREMTSGGQWDPRNEFVVEKDLLVYQDRNLWRKNREVLIEKAWKDLVTYASDNSWISVDNDVVNLQPEVRLPMRQLLRHNPIYLMLQKDAAKYFEGCAAADPEKWPELISEALYHRFHLEGCSAGSRWRNCLNSQFARSTEARACIVEVPLSSDFVDENNRPIKYDGTPLVDSETLILAAFENAYLALVQRLRVRVTQQDLQKLEDTFYDACHKLNAFERNFPASPLSTARRQMIDAAQRILTNGQRFAENRLCDFLRHEKRNDLRLVVHLLLARYYAMRRPEVADRHSTKASQTARLLKDPPVSQLWIEFWRGRRLEQRGRYSRAQSAYTKALRLGVRENPVSSTCPELYRRITTILRKSGLWSEAASFANNKMLRPLKEDSVFQFERAYSNTRIALNTYDLTTAVGSVPTTSSKEPDQKGMVSELNGLVLSAAMDFQSAESALNSARRSYEASSFGPTYAVVRQASLFLDQLGNPWLASETLDSVRDQELRRNLEPFVEHSLLRARAQLRLGKQKPAYLILRRLSKAVRTATLRTRLRVASHVLALTRPSRSEVLRFLNNLKELQPIAARYLLLEGFDLSTSSKIEDFGLFNRFQRVIPAPRVDSADFAVRALLWAYGARFFGGRAQANHILLKAYHESNTKPNLQRQIRNALTSPLNKHKFPPLQPYLDSYAKAFQQFPNLMATAWIEEAERIRDGSPLPEELAKKARQQLQIRSPSMWHVRLAALPHETPMERERALIEANQIAIRIGDYSAKALIRRLLKELRPGAARTFNALSLLAPRSELKIVRSTVKNQPALKVVQKNESHHLFSRKVIFDGVLAENDWEAPISNYNPLLMAKMTTGGVSGLVRSFLGEDLLMVNETVALFIEKGGLSAVPWELGFDPPQHNDFYRVNFENDNLRSTVLWLQSALSREGHELRVDGMLGQRTKSALLKFGKSPREARTTLWALLRTKSLPTMPTVCVAQANREEQRYMKRGHGIIGADLPDLYMMSGAKVQQISDTSPSAFMYALTYSTPSIIHVVSSFQESPRTGEIYLDLGALGFEGKPIDDDVLVTAGLIDSLMRKTIRDDVPPFMIVEGIVPPDSYDRARQAVLRNAFCSQLFRLGRARGVLGTGLYEPTSLLQSLQVIVNALNARETIGKLHRDLWILGNHVVPPALFTSDPELPVIW